VEGQGLAADAIFVLGSALNDSSADKTLNYVK
jgi:hypothetical protein